jgi:thioredoxin reductase (NADPH)
MEEWDLVIIGGGPASMAAGIYGVRSELKTVIIEKEIPGGQIARAGMVENYPGFPDGIRGMELADRMKLQAENAGVKFKTLEEVEKIEKKDKKDKKEDFIVTTTENEYRSKAVIICTGLRHVKLNVPGEKEFSGRGVSYCATCDGPIFKMKKVVVVGSGTGAVMAALNLNDLAGEVKLIMKRNEPNVSEKIIKTRLDNSKVELLRETWVKEIIGDQNVKALRVFDLKSGREYEMDTDGIFIEVGKVPNTGFLGADSAEVELNDKKYIIVDENQNTNIKGIYAAGDVTAARVKQVATAVAQGSVAALDAYKYIKL